MMMDEPWYKRVQREAAERVAAQLALPMPDEGAVGEEGRFDPWDLFPSLYGSYSSEFDRCAIEVLSEIRDREHRREDLGADMFREMLCTAELCDYGTSPHACFASQQFGELLPALIEKWRDYARIQRGTGGE
jgi:hypothetical protein